MKVHSQLISKYIVHINFQCSFCGPVNKDCSYTNSKMHSINHYTYEIIQIAEQEVNVIEMQLNHST